jgi:hypothetical protein
MKLTIHPIAEVIPRATEEEAKEIFASVKRKGQLVPILITADNQILDGRHRYQACKFLGVDPKVTVYDGPMDNENLLHLVAGLNVARRHLSVKQRAALAAEMANVPQHSNQHTKAGPANLPDHKNQPPQPVSGKIKGLAPQPEVAPEPEPLVSQAAAAKAFKVSERSIRQAAKVRREDPEAFEAMKRGEAAPKPPAMPMPTQAERDEADERAALGRWRKLSQELQEHRGALGKEDRSEVLKICAGLSKAFA